ncbi:helix-turn-helix domain-containing protein [Paenibacillus sp. YIM B09110]|uniref:helix-turn-helix domain-containing protein n=1 Tax=Paenibacillus sp. YIM B09110 TaxID=3126102 RepID=UPI00301BC419
MKWPSISPIFRNFLISYIIVLLIPLIAGYASYRTSINFAESIFIENSLMTLNQSKEILEQRFAEVEGFTKQLAINEDLRLLISEKKIGNRYNVYGLWKTARDVTSYSQTNDFLSNFYIYLSNYNVIITPKSIYYRPEHFFELNYYKGMTFSQWEETLLNKNHLNEIMSQQPFIRNRQKSNVITFAQSLPLNSFNKPMANIVVLIDTVKIGHLLDSIYKKYGGWSFITDNQSNTLISNGISEQAIHKLTNIPSGELDDKIRMQNGMLLISIRSDLNGWVYTAGIPQKSLMEKADKIKDLTGVFTAAALLLGLFIGLVLAYRNSAPINRLLTMFSEHVGLERGRTKNEYELITGNISHLIVSNKLLKTELNEQLPLLRDAFIKRLLVGEIHSIQEIEAAFSQTGIELKGEYGYVGIMKINGYSDINNEEIIQELSVARIIMRQALHGFDSEFLITDWGTDKIAIIHFQDSEPKSGQGSDIDAIMTQLVHLVFGQFHLSINIGLSVPFQHLRDISQSFDEAKQALEYAVYVGDMGIAWYQDTIRDTTMYDYPIDLEQRLFNTLKAGEVEESKRILMQLFTRNFVERELLYDMKERLVIELKGTLLKLIDQKAYHDESFAEKVKDQLVQARPTDDAALLRGKFEKIMEAICDMILKKKLEQHHDTVREVIQFIQQQFGDPNLTLHSIAENVGRPEKDISQLFKEQTGENLFDYIERIRIEHATVLLIEDVLSIDQITVKAGYNSSHSFRRAFKRVKGVSPSTFRKSV